MKTNTAFGMFILGLVLTMFGVGGVENSLTDLQLLSSVAVAAVGLLIMWVGTLGVRNGSYYDER
jgi:hypothetical protein